MAEGTPPSIKLNGAAEPTTTMAAPVPFVDVNELNRANDGNHVYNVNDASQANQSNTAGAYRPAPARADTQYSMMSVPPEGSILTGKQEHCTRDKPPIRTAC